MNPSIIAEAFAWRYATKEFDKTKKIDQTTLDTITEAMRATASSYGLQPWKFVIVQNDATREELRKVAWNQAQITDASHLIVLCRHIDITKESVEKYISHISQVREVPADHLDGFKKMMIDMVEARTPEALREWASRQVYIALGTLLETAALLKVDSCPMEGFDNAKFDEILGLKEKGLTSVVVATLGYRSDTDAMASYKKVRFPKEEVIVTI